MKRSNSIFSHEAATSISVDNSINNASLWGRFVEVVKSVCGLSELSDFTIDDRAQDFSVFQSMATSPNVGCSIVAIDGFTAQMLDTDRLIAQDYMQGVSLRSIARRHGVSKSYVVKALASISDLMN